MTELQGAVPVQDATSVPEEARRDTPGAIAGRIAFVLRQDGFGTGPLAELRRLDPDGALVEPALHRLLARHLTAERVKGADALGDWALIIHCLALAAPGQLDGAARLGRALQQAGLKEQRFTRLLQATSEDLRDGLPRAIRFLVHQGGRLRAPDVADLVLSARSADWGGRVRQRIAGDYYRAEYEAGATASAN